MDFTEYIMPELLILVPVLYLIGAAIKRSDADDRIIPVILGLFGMMLATLYVFSVKGYGDVPMALFMGITQGVLCAGAAVYANQIYKQAVRESRAWTIRRRSARCSSRWGPSSAPTRR